MIFKIGNTDITPYIALGGIKYTRNDVDGQNAGRTISGTMIRDRITTKGKWEISFVTVESSVARTLMALVEPETFVITTDFPTGIDARYTCYSNNVPVTFSFVKNGVEYYSGLSIPIVEM